MSFPVRTPGWLMALAPGLLWHMPRGGNAVYLTFDDGPHPRITPRVLDLLAAHDAKATFFCVGQNVERHPDVLRRAIAEGHQLGNHTHRHLNGWKHGRAAYLADVEAAGNAMADATGQAVTLFRPPYGRLNLMAWPRIAQGHRIVMWDVVAGDWRADWPVDQVQRNVLGHARPGSVVVLHDSEKAEARMFPVLEEVLREGARRGWRFLALPGLTSR